MSDYGIGRQVEDALDEAYSKGSRDAYEDASYREARSVADAYAAGHAQGMAEGLVLGAEEPRR